MPSPSDRIYRPKQSLRAAREEIAKWAGRQFDPEVVKVFLEMPDNIWDDLRNEIHDQIYRIAHSAGRQGLIRSRRWGTLNGHNPSKFIVAAAVLLTAVLIAGVCCFCPGASRRLQSATS